MSTPVTAAPKKRLSPLIALCGNPNSGKTTIFNALTGLNQRVANYPGVTVERTTGFLRADAKGVSYELLDIPGTYSLAPLSPDEKIAIAALTGELEGGHPDAIVCVLDASNLERSLFFLLQVQQIEAPVVVALNMMDIAERKGLTIDIAALSQQLGGIPIIPMQGNRNRGIAQLQQAVTEVLKQHNTRIAAFPDKEIEIALQEMVAPRTATIHTRAYYLRALFDADSEIEKEYLDDTGAEGYKALIDNRVKLVERFGSLSAAETTPLIQRSDELFKATVTKRSVRNRELTDKVDAVLLHPVAGPIILLLILGLIFQSIFSWAQPFMEWIDAFFGWLGGTVGAMLPEGALRSLITDGIIGGVGSVIVFIPQIAILFIFLSILEDSGYVTRAAFLVDRLFRFCGLSGKSLIPMLSSFACAIPGIMAARTIEDRNQRLITIMVAPLMTCSARLPVYAVMIAAFIPYKSYGIFNLQGLVLGALYLLGVLAAVIAALVMNKLLFKTEKASFLIEMPTYKLPTWQSIVTRVVNRTKAFVTRAGTIILAITIVIWAASYYPRSSDIQAHYDEAAVEESTAFIAADTQLEKQITQIQSTKPDADNQVLNDTRLLLEGKTASEDVTAIHDSVAALYPNLSNEITLLALQRELGIAYTDRIDSLAHAAAGEQMRNSYFGRLGHMIEPMFAPLGWDWRITMAALASFPAREVIIAVLGTIYNLGADVDESSNSLINKLQAVTWDHGDKIGQPVFGPAVALSIMVFFALCCQCGATIVTIKQETARWSYAIATFLYMTILAYIGAFVTYQFFTSIGW